MSAAVDPIAALYDAVLDYASDQFMRHGRHVHWEVTIGDVRFGYRAIVTVGPEIAASGIAKSLAVAVHDARVQFEQWADDRDLAPALEASIAYAKADKEDGHVQR